MSLFAMLMMIYGRQMKRPEVAEGCRTWPYKADDEINRGSRFPVPHKTNQDRAIEFDRSAAYEHYP